MKTSMNELMEIENYLLYPDNASREAFEQRLIREPRLKDATKRQALVYRVLRFYGRKILRTDAKDLDAKMFSDESSVFFQKVASIFKT